MIVTAYQVSLIGHLIGLALGVGGAYVSDALFFLAIKDRVITKAHLATLKLTSLLVVFGLAILILSGLSLFLRTPDFYLASHKFIVKMAVVSIITLNGIFFHVIHIPRLTKVAGQPLSQLSKIRFAREFLLISGAFSSVSWTAALILGAIPSSPNLGYPLLIAVYLLAVTAANIPILLFRKKLIPDLELLIAPNTYQPQASAPQPATIPSPPAPSYPPSPPSQPSPMPTTQPSQVPPPQKPPNQPNPSSLAATSPSPVS